MTNNYEELNLENQLCFPLYAASREMIKKYHPLLADLGLTYTQYLVLLVLWKEETMSVRGLGDKLHLDSGTLTPLLKGLEKKGWISRTRSKEDERFLIVKITEEGEALKEQAKDIPMTLACDIGLSEEDAKTLYMLLYRLLDVMKE